MMNGYTHSIISMKRHLQMKISRRLWLIIFHLKLIWCFKTENIYLMMTWEKVINLIRSNIFKLEDIFTIVRGERQTEASRKEGTIPYYSASQENNGITDFISNPTFTSSNKIVVSTFCHAYWAEGVFSASDE